VAAICCGWDMEPPSTILKAINPGDTRFSARSPYTVRCGYGEHRTGRNFPRHTVRADRQAYKQVFTMFKSFTLLVTTVNGTTRKAIAPAYTQPAGKVVSAMMAHSWCRRAASLRFGPQGLEIGDDRWSSHDPRLSETGETPIDMRRAPFSRG